MENQPTHEVLKDRERICLEIARIMNSFVESREKKIKYKRNRNTALLKRITERLIFMVENPEKMRKEVILSEFPEYEENKLLNSPYLPDWLKERLKNPISAS